MENLFRIWVEQRYVNAELLNIGIIPEFFSKWFDIFFKDTCNRVPYYYSHYPFCKKVLDRITVSETSDKQYTVA